MVRITIDSKSLEGRMSRFEMTMRPRIFEVLGVSFDNIRARAAQSIIPNITGFRNPHFARKIQPSTSGKLTERTGKMIKALKYDTQNPGSGYSKGSIRTKVTPALTMRLRYTPNLRNIETYEGNLLPIIREPLAAFLSNRGNYRPDKQGNRIDAMPKETAKTIRARFLWENTSVKGSKGRRRYLGEAVKIELELMNRKLEDVLDSMSFYLKGTLYA